jgi:hypothetical protein
MTTSEAVSRVPWWKGSRCGCGSSARSGWLADRVGRKLPLMISKGRQIEADLVLA